ncbi:MAG: hypothetical protein ACTSXL_00025 [Alphaproteobacteria bacterium]|nr:MAG: hypothetical protein B6I23_00240 [Rickettsiaceae bacterium 4572_127]
MAIKIGERDLASEVLELNINLRKTQLILEKIIEKNNIKLSDKEVFDSEKNALNFVREKYPNSSISFIENK